jgi:outer membrane lipoprotein-sorting protein
MFPERTLSLRRAFLLAFAVAGLFLFSPALLSAQTADDVVNAYIKARGGLAKIRAVQTERLTGTVSFAQGVDGPFFVERKRPLKMRMEMNVNGLTLIRVYDGKSSGWMYNPFVPNAAVEPMKAPELQGIAEEADYDGPFVDYKAKGNQIEYVGKEDVEGKPAQKLKLTSKQGTVSYFFFDAATGFVV